MEFVYMKEQTELLEFTSKVNIFLSYYYTYQGVLFKLDPQAYPKFLPKVKAQIKTTMFISPSSDHRFDTKVCQLYINKKLVARDIFDFYVDTDILGNTLLYCKIHIKQFVPQSI